MFHHNKTHEPVLPNTAVSSNKQDTNNRCEQLKNMPVPNKMRVVVGDLGFVKEGEKLFLLRYKTLISREPGQKKEDYCEETEQVIKEPPQEISMSLFEELWKTITSFNFSTYNNLQPEDYRTDKRASSFSDAHLTWTLFLSVEGERILFIDFGERKPKSASLESDLYKLNDHLYRIIKTPTTPKN